MEEALRRMVMIADESMKMHEFMEASGYGETPYEKIYGMAADAIFFLLGEDKDGYDTFDKSITYNTLHADIPVENKIVFLTEAYRLKQAQQKTDPLI